MAGSTAERQERGVVDAINNAVKKNQKNPVTVVAGKTTIEGVIKAGKYSGRQLSGSEPYTDVVLTTHAGKEINLSLKGEAAPSLAGGGQKGLELVLPGITKRFMKQAFVSVSKSIRPGDKVPDVFGKISEADKVKIVVGNKAMGGPIDYMYIGPMDVSSSYDTKLNIVRLNGELTAAKVYARTHQLYFRLRARREDQRFDPLAKDPTGTPRIYGKSPSKGDSAGRIVVTDSVPSTALIVRM